MSTLPTHLGLSPEDMISYFNRMYLDVWEKTRDKINWQEKDLPTLFLDVLEVVVTAVRDACVLTLYENNERVYQDLMEAGIRLKEKIEEASEEETSEK